MYLSDAILRRGSLFSLALWVVLASGLGAPARAQSSDRPTARATVKELVRSKSKAWIGIYAIAQDGKTLAYEDSYPEGKQRRCDLVLVDLDTGQELHRRQLDWADVSGAVFSADGKLLAISSFGFGVGPPGGKVVFGAIWDVAHWQPKVQLRALDGYWRFWPLAFIQDGKVLVGRAQGKAKQPAESGNPFLGGGWVRAHDLLLWDADTAAPRVVKAPGAKLVLPMAGFGGLPQGMYFVGPKGKQQDHVPGEPLVGLQPVAVTFADQGRPELLFVQYHVGGREGVTTAWDMVRGKPLTSTLGYDYTIANEELAGTGAPVPNSPFDLYRYRLTPGGRILQLPRYDLPPLLIVTEARHRAPGETMISMVLRVVVRLTDRPFQRSYTELWRLGEQRQGTSRTWRLTPDGRRLVTVEGGLFRVWNLSALLPLATRKQDQLSAVERDKLWANLCPDPVPGVVAPYEAMALAAMVSLVRHGEEGVAWLRQRLGPPWDLRQIPRLIEELGSSSFAEREQATQQLTKAAPVVRPLLERALRKDQPPEVKRRLESILGRLAPSPAVYEIRQLRIIDVLEHINTPAARELLQRVADGKYDPAFADVARQALRRATAKAKDRRTAGGAASRPIATAPMTATARSASPCSSPPPAASTCPWRIRPRMASREQLVEE